MIAFHEGGMVYAHAGWPLKADEVPIIAQTGERVLSRDQNRAYEAGGNPINITIETHTKNPVQITTQNEGGGNIRVIFDELLEEAINNGGRGAKAIDNRFGARAQTVTR